MRSSLHYVARQKRGTQRFKFMICMKMLILKLKARKSGKLLQANKKIFYQNKESNKSNVCKLILPQIRIQILNLVKSALVDIFTNIILE